ncbi:hypothetical protein CQW23_15435 [Capsicum baccatum]|uniref:Uncharacterized protein n=1 Tax=Capsicum baccatum TaxID=33114 RepID=A0A2G2WM10_CAPBA|nr:hypothetical protein CQW23_15435 [Capsicum baccatum]
MIEFCVDRFYHGRVDLRGIEPSFVLQMDTSILFPRPLSMAVGPRSMLDSGDMIFSMVTSLYESGGGEDSPMVISLGFDGIGGFGNRGGVKVGSMADVEVRGAASPACIFSPLFRFSQHNGSELYDSFELQAVAKQLNRALVKASAQSSSPTTCAVLNSPFYTKCLGGVYKKNVKVCRRISCSQSRNNDGAVEKYGSRKINSVFLRFWNMAKHGFLRGNSRVK